MLLSNDASRNCISSFLDEVSLQQQVTVPTNKSGGILDQVITSEEVEVSEPLENFFTSSGLGIVHFDFLQLHKKLAFKKASCRKWRNFNVTGFAETRNDFFFRTCRLANRIEKYIEFNTKKGLKNRVLNFMWKFVNERFDENNICSWHLCCDCQICRNNRTIF